MAELLQQFVIVASEDDGARFTLYLSRAGKRAQFATAFVPHTAAVVIQTDLNRIITRHQLARQGLVVPGY